MSANLALNDLSINLTGDESVIVNTIVENNIIIVQYKRGSGILPIDNSNLSNMTPTPVYGPVINCNTKMSFDHGKTWKEITLDIEGETYEKYGIMSNELYSHNGSTIGFIVRHKSGGRVLMFTPIYRVCPRYMDEMHLVSHPLVIIAGWLVHDETGRRHNKHLLHPMKEFDNSLDTSFLSQFSDKIYIDPITAKITPSTLDYQTSLLSVPFVAYPYEGHLESDKSTSSESTRVVNTIDTVVHEYKGKTYTIVKRYFNVFFRKGNIFSKYDPSQPDKVPTKFAVDYYAITIPFLYVFDHKDFNNDTKSLVWIDVLGLVKNTKSLVGSARGSKKTQSFIQSLISDDPHFLKLMENNNAYYRFATDASVALSTSLVFTKTPCSVIFTYRDKSNDRSLTGFIHCSRQLVCYSEPIELVGWLTPTPSNPLPVASFLTSLSLNLLTETSIHTLEHTSPTYYSTDLDIHYTTIQTYYSKRGVITFSKDNDRLVLLPSIENNEIVYKPVYFTIDNTTRRVGLTLGDSVSSIGYRGITDIIYDGDIGGYPVEIKTPIGLIYSSDNFLIEGTVNYTESVIDNYEVIDRSFIVQNP